MKLSVCTNSSDCGVNLIGSKIRIGEHEVSLLPVNPILSKLGDSINTQILNFTLTEEIDIIIAYKSLGNGYLYYVSKSVRIPQANVNIYDELIIGLLSDGTLLIYLSDGNSVIMIERYKAEIYSLEKDSKSIKKISQFVNSSEAQIEAALRQYTYRYVLNTGGLLNVMINAKKIDGTRQIDCKIDGRFSTEAVPEFLSISFENRQKYSIYIWINGDRLASVFKRLSNSKSNSKLDFILDFDINKHSYKIFLLNSDLKQKMQIDSNSYQLIVFKSGLEDYRSENYNQPSGSWIW